MDDDCKQTHCQSCEELNALVSYYEDALQQLESIVEEIRTSCHSYLPQRRTPTTDTLEDTESKPSATPDTPECEGEQ